MCPAVQTVGLGYSAWFWWNYVLFADGRKDLNRQLARLQSGITHTIDDITDKTRALGCVVLMVLMVLMVLGLFRRLWAGALLGVNT